MKVVLVLALLCVSALAVYQEEKTTEVCQEDPTPAVQDSKFLEGWERGRTDAQDEYANDLEKEELESREKEHKDKLQSELETTKQKKEELKQQQKELDDKVFQLNLERVKLEAAKKALDWQINHEKEKQEEPGCPADEPVEEPPCHEDCGDKIRADMMGAEEAAEADRQRDEEIANIKQASADFTANEEAKRRDLEDQLEKNKGELEAAQRRADLKRMQKDEKAEGVVDNEKEGLEEEEEAHRQQMARIQSQSLDAKKDIEDAEMQLAAVRAKCEAQKAQVSASSCDV